MSLMIIALGISSYFLGSIPFGYILTKYFCKIDIRTMGSKNIGATNVGRVVGWKYGFPVLLLDIAKGAIPVLIARFGYVGLHEWDTIHFSLVIGGLSIIGHVTTPFLRFRGGKGVATALGVCLSLIPITTLSAVSIFFLVYKISGYVSLGSIIASLLMPVLYLFFDYMGINQNYSNTMTFVLLGLGILITLVHKDNMVRIYKGEELKATSKRSI